MSLAAPRLHRLHSLDQFRGYTVAAMFVVNFAGGYLACPAILRHHNDYCSFADTIMPSFLFVVGFAFRLTFERRVQHEGVRAAYARVIRRLSGLVLVSLVIYAPAAPADTWDALRNMGLVEALDPVLKRDWCQTLMHIALTSLWITPVIRASARTRVLWLLLSAAAHVVLSWWFNFDWCNTSPMAIDGGPLGFLTWSIPALVGTLACDAFMRSQGRPDLRTLTMSAVCLMGCGWLMSLRDSPVRCPCQQAGTTARSEAGRRSGLARVVPSAHRVGRSADGRTTVRSAARYGSSQVELLDDEPARRNAVLPHIRSWLLAGHVPAVPHRL